MTAREVVMCSKSISKRAITMARFEAKIHGAELSDNSQEKMHITKESDEQMDKITDRSYLELLKRRDGLKNGK